MVSMTATRRTIRRAFLGTLRAVVQSDDKGEVRTGEFPVFPT
jgi:hypothetical protein